MGGNWKADAIIKSIGDLEGKARALHIAERIPELSTGMVAAYIMNSMLGRYVEVVGRGHSGGRGTYFNIYGLTRNGWRRYEKISQRDSEQ